RGLVLHEQRFKVRAFVVIRIAHRLASLFLAALAAAAFTSSHSASISALAVASLPLLISAAVFPAAIPATCDGRCVMCALAVGIFSPASILRALAIAFSGGPMSLKTTR